MKKTSLDTRFIGLVKIINRLSANITLDTGRNYAEIEELEEEIKTLQKTITFLQNLPEEILDYRPNDIIATIIFSRNDLILRAGDIINVDEPTYNNFIAELKHDLETDLKEHGWNAISKIYSQGKWRNTVIDDK